MFMDLASRATLCELMDDPGCNETLLLRTVRQFASINRLVSRYRTILRKQVLDDMLRDPTREYHLVDMGAGGCDIDAWLLNAAQREGLKLRITACDIDQRIIDYARSEYGHVEGLTILNQDLIDGSITADVDYVFANHFLHHLPDGQIIRLLRKWKPFVRRRMVFSDLHRAHAAYAGFALLSLFFPRSFARTDGLISIRRGFVPGELAELATQALPHTRFSVGKLVPGRLVLDIDGSDMASSTSKERFK